MVTVPLRHNEGRLEKQNQQKSSVEGTNGSERAAKLNRLTTISARKLQANRENAKKSTGPKTLRGKAFSRTNALTHGLFAKCVDLIPAGEDPNEFRELLQNLSDVYQPVGAAEELEVHRIAICGWRHLRAWRCENAELSIEQMDFEWEEHKLIREKEMTPTYKTLLALLESAEKEIRASGSISQELQEKMFAISAFTDLWQRLEEKVKDCVKNKQERIELGDGKKILFSVSLQEVRTTLSVVSDTQAELPAVIALTTTRLAIGALELNNAEDWKTYFKFEYNRHAIPNAEAMARILAYEAANDRSLGHALERLERLQRRRKGEPVLPPLRVRLTK